MKYVILCLFLVGCTHPPTISDVTKDRCKLVSSDKKTATTCGAHYKCLGMPESVYTCKCTTSRCLCMGISKPKIKPRALQIHALSTRSKFCSFDYYKQIYYVERHLFNR